MAAGCLAALLARPLEPTVLIASGQQFRAEANTGNAEAGVSAFPPMRVKSRRAAFAGATM